MLGEHSGTDQFWAGHPKLGELVGQSPAEKPTVEPRGSELPLGRGWIDPPRAKKWGISFYSPEVGSVPARALWQMPLWQSDGRVVPVPSGLGCTEVAFWDGVEEGEHLCCWDGDARMLLLGALGISPPLHVQSRIYK